MVDKLPLLGQALAALGRAPAPARTSASARNAGKRLERKPPGPGAPSVEQQILSRIAHIDPEDPQRRRRALRVVVEISLVHEFGAQLAADPAFHSLVDQVAETMGDSPTLASVIDTALKGSP